MTLYPEQFFRAEGGEATESMFQPCEDPLDIVGRYIVEAEGKVAGVDAALRDGIAAKWVYYRIFNGAFAWIIMEPEATDVGDAGSANFFDPSHLLKLAQQYKEEFETALAAALATPAARPFGPARNQYVF